MQFSHTIPLCLSVTAFIIHTTQRQSWVVATELVHPAHYCAAAQSTAGCTEAVTTRRNFKYHVYYCNMTFYFLLSVHYSLSCKYKKWSMWIYRWQSRYIFWAQTLVPASFCGGDLNASAKEISRFQIHVTVQLRVFHLTFSWNWLICSVMTC